MKMDKSYEITELTKDKMADYNIKAVFLGNSGVGKTSIIKYELENKFLPGIITNVFDYSSKKCKINDKIIHLQIWDLCGDETYDKITTNFYRAALCFFVVFSLTDKNSFFNLDKWINRIKNEPQSLLPIIILIGNKNDIIDDRKITKEEIEDFKIRNNIDCYFETSAKSGEAIHELFKEVIKKLYIKFIEPTLSEVYSITSSQSTSQSILTPCADDSEKCKVCDCIVF